MSAFYYEVFSRLEVFKGKSFSQAAQSSFVAQCSRVIVGVLAGLRCMIRKRLAFVGSFVVSFLVGEVADSVSSMMGKMQFDDGVAHVH